MLLMTSIQPRRDGTVTLRTPSGQAIVFKPNEHGDLVAEVEDKRAIELALVTGDFEPYNEADQPLAASILFPDVPSGGSAPRVDAAGGGDDDDDDPDRDVDDDPDAPGAPPIEANTPPAPAGGKPAGAAGKGRQAGSAGQRSGQGRRKQGAQA